jgi:hypothetical protein
MGASHYVLGRLFSYLLLRYCTSRLHLLLVLANHLRSKTHDGEVLRHTKMGGEVHSARPVGTGRKFRL